jgi:elongation factor P--(R)-beta-lysine ligase
MAGQRLTGRALEVQGSRVLLADGLQRRWLELDTAGGAPAPISAGQWLVVDVPNAALAEPLPACVVRCFAGELRPVGERARFERVAPCLQRAAAARRWVRHYFDAHDFVEVQTPVRVAAPDPSVYIAPHATSEGWLITSPEFHMKRLLVGGLPRVYQFASCTRDDEVGVWHQPEFTMLEWYRAFEDMGAVMADTEALVCELVGEFGSGNALVLGATRVEVVAPFERLTVREAFRSFAGVADASDLAQCDEDRYFQLFVDEVEPALLKFDRPVFMTEYPRSQAALAVACEHDETVAERFELYVAGVELCNGYGELTCPVEQRRRFELELLVRQQRGLPALPLDTEFLDALGEGMPPAAGNALGFDRLMALVLGVPLSDVVAFPRTREAR